MSSPLFAPAFLEVRETPSGSLSRAIVNGGLDVGHHDAFSEYGHKPWQKGYKDEQRFQREWAALDRFQAEYAMIKGAQYTARDFGFGGKSLTHDSADAMDRHRQVLGRYSRRKG